MSRRAVYSRAGDGWRVAEDHPGQTLEEVKEVNIQKRDRLKVEEQAICRPLQGVEEAWKRNVQQRQRS